MSNRRSLLCVSAAVLALLAGAAAGGTSFTYQGELEESGAPANGVYDLKFQLRDAATGGAMIGAEQCADNVSVVNGKFAVVLDFGAVFNGASRYLQIRVRPDTGQGCGNDAGFVSLDPRQQVTSSPSATYADSTANALNVGGVPASDLARLSGNQTFTGQINFTNAASTFRGSFQGNGSQLTGLNGGNIAAGTILRSSVGSDIESVLAQWAPHPAVPPGFDNSGAFDWETFDIPAAPPGVTYTQLTGGNVHNIGLRSDGSVVAWGENNFGQLDVPPLPAGVRYVQVAAGYGNCAALRSDGAAVAWGWNGYGQNNVPTLPAGVTYTFIECGERHSVALRSDGSAVAFGQGTVVNATFGNFGQCIIPALPAGMRYTRIAAGNFHTVVLRSDGAVFAMGWNSHGQSTVPTLPAGRTVVEVAAGAQHSVLLMDDGSIFSWGNSGAGLQNVPALPAGVRYTKVAAGNQHTVALRSDGQIVVWGQGTPGLLNPPAPPSGSVYYEIGAGYWNAMGLAGTPSVPAPASVSSSVGVSIGGGARPPEGGLSVAGDVVSDGTLSAASLRATDPNRTSTFAGRVGVGTSSPLWSLQVNTADNRTGLVHYNDDCGTALGTLTLCDSAAIGTMSSHALRFFTDNNAARDIMVLTTDGRVGIGTRNPSEQLTVSGLIESTQGFKFPDGTIQTTAGGAGGDTFVLNGTSAVYTGGSVGVGTLTPQTRLDVRGANASETAIRGMNNASGVNIGVHGEVINGYGVLGKATNVTGAQYGVYGQTLSGASNAFGVYSNGRLGSSGTKSFVIDHPLDPAHKVLMHYCTEGPEPLNVYSGIATLDDGGVAEVTLPAYFSEINTEPRYQLTAIGGPALLYVSHEIENNRFEIAGGRAGMKVSWEVKAVRNDAFVRRYGAPVEAEKPANEKGTYIRPELFEGVTPAQEAVPASR